MRLRPTVRDIAIVLAVSWVARAVFVAAIGDHHSLDVEFWRIALDAQDEGRNPYETGRLNWPPLWLMVIVALDHAASAVDVSFLSALRLYLVLIESAIVAALYLTLLRAGARRDAVRRALLFGIALNPIAILLVCQHGNSDVQVGLLVILAVAALLAHGRSRDVVFWLVGCLLLGMGVLAKTVPLILAPVLAPGARLASTAGRALGAMLLLGPAVLGVGVILALAPRAVWDHVIGYRSIQGYFGVSGILGVHFPGDPAGHFEALTGVDIRGRYGTLFTLAVLVLVVWLGRRFWREAPLAPDRLFLVVAIVPMVLVAFGPGYGPQYAYWFLPALVATYVLLDDGWRKLLLIGYAVAAVTYAVEYAFVTWLGAYATAGDAGWTADVSNYLDDPRRLTLFRLPLFAIYLLVVGAGVARLAALRVGRAAEREP
jgi:hypothetical protein